MPTKSAPRKRIKKSTSRISKSRGNLSKTKVPPQSKQRLVRTSERGIFQTCKHAWQWAYLEQLKPIQEAPALSFGNLIHQALEKRYPPGIKRGPHPAQTFEKLYDEFTKEAYKLGFSDDEGQWQEAGELGVDMLENYVDYFGKDEEWKVLASEMTFQVPVFDEDEYVFTYVGTLDGLWENRMDGGVRINDYKTCKGDPEQEIRNVGYTGALGLQPGAYWCFGVDALIREGILRKEKLEALDGMVFTYLRKGKRDQRPQNDQGQYLNQDGSVSKRQPSPLIHREVTYRSDHERERYRRRAIRQVRKMMALENGPAEDRLKEPGWMTCRMCQFKDACELHELDSSWEAYLEGSTQKWEPYSAHEIQEAERR